MARRRRRVLRVRVWRRIGYRGAFTWWWWCDCCWGGDFEESHAEAVARADYHARRAHPKPFSRFFPIGHG